MCNQFSVWMIYDEKLDKSEQVGIPVCHRVIGLWLWYFPGVSYKANHDSTPESLKIFNLIGTKIYANVKYKHYISSILKR